MDLDPHLDFQRRRRALKTLRQGSRPLRQFRIEFETAINQFPTDRPLKPEYALDIFLDALNPRLRQLLEPTLYDITDWRAACERAQKLEARLLCHQEEDTIGTISPAAPALSSPDSGIVSEPMDIDAISYRKSARPTKPHGRPQQSFHGRPRFHGSPGKQVTRGKQHYNGQHRPASKPRRWTKDGKPICEHCRELHYSKSCPHRVDSADVQTSNSSVAAPVSSGDTTCAALQYIWNTDATYTGPRLPCSILGRSLSALIDTGSSITAVSAKAIDGLSINLDKSRALQFSAANRTISRTLGTARLPLSIQNHEVSLEFHVINNLAHEVIIGYPELRRLSATIDAANNQITFALQAARVRAISSPVSITSTLRLPPFSYSYIDVQGPANCLAFVQTEPTMVASRCLSVAAGLIQFDASGTAVVKITNLGRLPIVVQTGQHVASLEPLPGYLVSEPPVVSSVSPSVGSFDPAAIPFGDSLTADQRLQLTRLLESFKNLFQDKVTTVTTKIKHTVDTGNHRPIASPPHPLLLPRTISSTHSLMICYVKVSFNHLGLPGLLPWSWSRRRMVPYASALTTVSSMPSPTGTYILCLAWTTPCTPLDPPKLSPRSTWLQATGKSRWMKTASLAPPSSAARDFLNLCECPLVFRTPRRLCNV